MPRNTALGVLEHGFEMVSITASHSASFHAHGKDSPGQCRRVDENGHRAVSPAPIAATRISMLVANPDVELRSLPLNPRLREIRRDSLRAGFGGRVPTTGRARSPRARAVDLPIPRDAPVTSATWPSEIHHALSTTVHPAPAPAVGERRALQSRAVR